MSCTIESKFVRDDSARNASKTFEQLPKEPPSGFFISTFLDQDAEDFAFLIHGSLQLDLSSIDLRKPLIEMPGIAAAPSVTSESARVFRAELERPEPNGLM